MLRKKGMTLVMVIIVMAVLSILGAALLGISVSETKFTANQDKRMQAYYLAKSGVDTIATHILRNPKGVQALVNAPESDVNNQLPNGSFKVDVINSGVANEIKVKGTGLVSGTQNTSTVVMKSLSLSEILDKAIYTNASMDITGMKVNGDIQSGGTIQYSSNGSNKYNDTAYPNSIRTIDFVAPFPPAGTDNLVIKNQIVTLSSSGSYNSIEVGQKGILRIRTNGNNISIALNTLVINNRLEIDNTGGGSVSIYVNNNMKVTTQGLINNKEPRSLFIYLKAGSTFEIQANMVLNAYIIGPEATVQIQSNGSTINGAVFSNVVRKNATGAGPNGTVNFVPLPAGTTPGSVVPTEYRIVRWEK
jgi:type II secretory pathway pseudopilin PulG